jgi:hypothetical protein
MQSDRLESSPKRHQCGSDEIAPVCREMCELVNTWCGISTSAAVTDILPMGWRTLGRASAEWYAHGRRKRLARSSLAHESKRPLAVGILAGSPIERPSERSASVIVARLHPRRQRYRT